MKKVNKSVSEMFIGDEVDQSRVLRDLTKRGIDADVIKDQIDDYIKSLRVLNSKIGNDGEIKRLLAELQEAFSKIFGSYVFELMTMKTNIDQAVEELLTALVALSKKPTLDISVRGVNSIMHDICQHHNCTHKELRDRFLEKHHADPHTWVCNFARKQKTDLTESYQDRVQQVADAVEQRSKATPFTKEELLRAIESEAIYARVGEHKLKNNPRSSAWKDFVKDVLAALKGKIKFGRPGVAATAAEKRAKQEQLLYKISDLINDAVGYSFPDGDPIDYIMPRIKKLGIDPYDAMPYLDKAAKKHLGSKTYYDYLADFWDQFMVDNPDLAKQYSMGQNPWRESIEPGDVLMLETETTAIVGTVLSNENGTIIIEGDVYSFDSNEVRQNLHEAKYQGREVQLNKPMRNTSGSKKFKVYVKNPKTGNIKKVSFGDRELSIKRDDPERRRSFRARHNCDQKKDKTTAGYWSCFMWRSGKRVSDIV